MQKAKNIDITDDLIVDSDKSHSEKTFKITVMNKGKRSIVLYNVVSYIRSVKVVDFSKEIIVSGGHKEYLFEAGYVPHDDSKKGKIRFTFQNQTQITRTLKIIHGPSSDKKNVKKREIDAKVQNKTVMPIKSIGKEEAKVNVKNVIKKLEKPKTMERGLLRKNLPKDDFNEFRGEYMHDVSVSDNLLIEFDRSHCDQSCEIFIRNNVWKQLYLKSICIDSKSVTLRGGNNGKIIHIEPRGEIVLLFDAVYVPDKLFAVAKVRFMFGKSLVVNRSIKICYRQKGPTISVNAYNVPNEFVDLIFSEFKISRSQLLDCLDQWIPTVEQDYAKHFHSLLYLEEIGLRKEIKDKYDQKKAFFGDTDYRKENGCDIREAYPIGIYDLFVDELFEIRPSLQTGE